MALFGNEAAKPFNDLRKITHEIQISAKNLAQLWVKQNRSGRTEKQEQEQDHFNRIQKHEAVFWEGLEDPDPINPKLQQCVNEIETTCKNILSAKGTVYSVLNCTFARIFKKKNS